MYFRIWRTAVFRKFFLSFNFLSPKSFLMMIQISKHSIVICLRAEMYFFIDFFVDFLGFIIFLASKIIWL